MFERTKVDNSRDTAAIAASVEMSDGRRVAGRFLVARSKTLIELLNGPTQFIEFEPYDGDVEIIAKSVIRSFRLLAAPTTTHSTALPENKEDFDPYKILGLKKGAGRAEVRVAFHQKAKAYHPDRYANTELPPEVLSYLAAMARRINAAHEVLAEESAKTEAFAAQRGEPVYNSASSL